MTSDLPIHTVTIFVTYRRKEPIPSKEWAEKTGLAFRHAPFVIEAVTAADMSKVNNENECGSNSHSSSGIHERAESAQPAETDEGVAGTT